MMTGFFRNPFAFMLYAACAALSLPGCSGERDEGNPYKYDIAKFEKNDTVDVLYEEKESLAPAAEKLFAIAVGPGGRLYSSGEKRIFVQDPDGTLRREISTNETVRCLAAGEAGRLFAGMERHVEVYDSGGDREAIWASLGENARVTAVDVHGKRVVLADAGNRMLWLYDENGTLLRLIGRREPGDPDSGFLLPSPLFDAAFAQDGTIWATDPGRLRLKHFQPGGKMIGEWGEASMEWGGFSGCCNPVRFCLLPGGGFVSVEKGIVRVKVFDSEGGFRGSAAKPGRFGPNDAGLLPAADASGILYLYSSRENRILRFFARPEYRKDLE